jgi:hypothetical protein
MSAQFKSVFRFTFLALPFASIFQAFEKWFDHTSPMNWFTLARALWLLFLWLLRHMVHCERALYRLRHTLCYFLDELVVGLFVVHCVILTISG